ncbi:MAG: YdiU family protein [Deltaproteobacteria bacterium]|jgi:serine/tyrosine/threonine adenylyltransferase|nr:YdiU family protein [Deltaproteobacteria bacterium]MBT6432884.1 YdiU family protein [Deltaproteobacteria bacterium]MBT6489889.1 YdiU family protein [Deltaproteobacteria bacterium]
MSENSITMNFDNSFVRELTGDPELENRRRQVMGACYSRVQPTPVSNPKALIWSDEMVQRLGIDLESWGLETFSQVFSGNQLLPGMDPVATCYGGYQFGSWAGQLGDGRAISLGEVVAGAERWEIQLKGSGPTPYSRMGDGRAVMRSSIREFLCSEAMHALGVPTTRALSLVATGDQILRDMFYDGNAAYEPGAIVCRAAPSFLRFGHFEILSAQKDKALLKRLADYAISTHFPELGSVDDEGIYLKWFQEVCRRTADMIVHWTRVGFVHGVMNTDNMSVLGLTIDYGPYGWLEAYDTSWTPNTTDAGQRRYSFGNQAQMAMWNLARFAESLTPLVTDTKKLEEAILGEYGDRFTTTHKEMALRKIGITNVREEEDDALLEGLGKCLRLVQTDMTLFYRRLAEIKVGQVEVQSLTEADIMKPLEDAWYQPEGISAEHRKKIAGWLQRYMKRLTEEKRTDAERKALMNETNPKYVMRNYLAQLAIEKLENGDESVLHELMEVMKRPYDEQPSFERFAEKMPEWARHKAGCSMLSCSS